MQLGRHPQPTAPWRPLIFRVHCVVTERWMKIRVPFAWFWFGDQEYGNPEVESGTIASTQPKPPEQVMAQAMQRMTERGPRMPVGEPTPLDAGPLPAPPPEPPLRPYRTPRHRALHQQSVEEQMASLQEELRQARSNIDQLMRGPDTNRGGR